MTVRLKKEKKQKHENRKGNIKSKKRVLRIKEKGKKE